MTDRWVLDELAHAGPEHLDPDYVAGYDRKSGTDPSEDLTVLHRFGAKEGGSVIDLGAGTGTFSLAAARTFGRVVAVDVSEPMLAALEQRAERAGLDNIACVRGGFLSYQHEGRPADVVHSRHALHQLPDFWKAVALDRIGRMLRPAGRFLLRDLVFDCEPAEVGDVVDDWLARAVEDSAQGWTADELAEHLQSEFSTFRWLLEPMLEHSGFEILDCEHRHRIYGRYLCAKR